MKPGKYDLPTIWRGCTYPVITFQWKLSNGDPIDLTNWTPYASSRNIDFNPVVTNALQGITTIRLTKAQTASLKLGTESWDWIFINNGSATPPLLAGQVTIKEPSTKPGAFIPPPPPPPPVPPVNDKFSDAILISGLNGAKAGTTVLATREINEPTGDNSVWYKWIPNSVVVAALQINNNVNKISVYTDTDPEHPSVGNLTHVATSVGSPPALTFVTDLATTYRIRVYKNSGTGPFTLTWSYSLS